MRPAFNIFTLFSDQFDGSNSSRIALNSLQFFTKNKAEGDAAEHSLLLALVAALIGLGAPQANAADVPQSFTLDGRLYSNSAASTALIDSSITFRAQILDEDKICILYEESQFINTATSNGYFSVQVGSSLGSSVRAAGDPGNTMAQVFQNLVVVSGKKVSDGTPCNAGPTGGKRRFVRVRIAPSSMGGAERLLSPDLTIDSVPNAIVAE